jgi:hypothetical protein
MKKLLLILLCLPFIGFGQYLPTETTYYQKSDINYPYAEKYIERGKAIELGYKDFLKNLNNIMEPKNDPDYEDWGVECENIISYYNKYNTVTEKMWMNLECVCSPWCHYGNLLSVTNASSTLFSNNNKYTINNMTDGDPRTVWAEGKDDYGIGEFFEVDFYHDSYTPSYILNGHQKSIELWRDNSRVKTFKVYYNNEPFCYLELDDNMQKQFFGFNIFFQSSFDLDQFKKYSSYDIIKKMRQDYIEVGKNEKYDTNGNIIYPYIFKIKFEIIDIYPGEKWKDVCISELKQYEMVGG